MVMFVIVLVGAEVATGVPGGADGDAVGSDCSIA